MLQKSLAYHVQTITIVKKEERLRFTIADPAKRNRGNAQIRGNVMLWHTLN